MYVYGPFMELLRGQYWHGEIYERILIAHSRHHSKISSDKSTFLEKARPFPIFENVISATIPLCLLPRATNEFAKLN
jgi:hypothetical protein